MPLRQKTLTDVAAKQDLHRAGGAPASDGAKDTGSPDAGPRATLSEPEFKAELIKMIPHLRAYAHSVARGHTAEDLAQTAMMKGWKSRSSFQLGTNFKAWMFTILRNEHYSHARRAWRTQPLDPEVAENTLVANDGAMDREELLDVRNAMQELGFDHRQALVLVTAAGLTYAEAAEICGCAVGTVKSRVSRARAELTGILERRALRQRIHTDVNAESAFVSIMTDAADMQNVPPGTSG